MKAMKISLRLRIAALALAAGAGMTTLTSCEKTSEAEKNASIVNVEKGVTSTTAVPDNQAGADDTQALPGLNMESAAKETAEEQTKEAAPAETEKEAETAPEGE